MLYFSTYLFNLNNKSGRLLVFSPYFDLKNMWYISTFNEDFGRINFTNFCTDLIIWKMLKPFAFLFEATQLFRRVPVWFKCSGQYQRPVNYNLFRKQLPR